MDVSSETLRDLCHFIGQECDAAWHRDRNHNQLLKTEHWYNQALKFDRENPELHYALSYLASEKKDYHAVVAHSTYAMKGLNTHIAQYNRAVALLMVGKYKQGFIDYDVRLDFDINRNSRNSRFGDLPYWSGEPCDTLYVCGEQGYGDIFQFSRYIPLIVEKFDVKKVFFEVPKDCQEIFSYNFNDEKVEVVSPAPLPKIDYHIQLISLCRLFDTRIGTIPPLKLNAHPEYIEKWKHVKGHVAFVYNGRKSYDDLTITEWNNRRQIPLNVIGPLFHIGGKPFFFEDNSDIKSWSDTAGIMANIGLLVTIDSGPAHLAGAMQIPTLLLNHWATCWRWGQTGYHTPWYTDDLTILRQRTEGDWDPVIEDAKKILEHLVKEKEAA